MEKRFFVYIMASRKNGTLYTGSTSELRQRVWAHKNDLTGGFTSRYQVHMLVYFEAHISAVEAVTRERQIKNWRRKWKLDLIEGMNPGWRDLY